MPPLKIEKLYTYPIKALRAIEVDSVEVTVYGFPHDRRFMLLHIIRETPNDPKSPVKEYKNIAIANYPLSVHFFPELDLQADQIHVTHRPHEGKESSISIPIHPETYALEAVNIDLHKAETTAYLMPAEYTRWFSERYGHEVALAYLGENFRTPRCTTTWEEKKQPSTSWLSSITSTVFGGSDAGPPSTLTFNDIAPYLIASTTSISDLSPRINNASHPNESNEEEQKKQVDILKFRPNIIISGAAQPWDEDLWGEIAIHSSSSPSPITIECVHNCGRCKSINIDYATGAPNAQGLEGELLKKMQKDRRIDQGVKYSPVFGRYSWLKPGSGEGRVSVGDEVEVTKVLKEKTRFDWEGLVPSTTSA